jgi:hypothetical protein
MRELVGIIACDTQPLQNLRVLNRIEDEKKEEWARHWITESLKGT